MIGQLIQKVAGKRLDGEQASVPQALATAGVAGAGAAALVYRLLRH